MNQELIDRAWACLPSEFREEVKKIWKSRNTLSRLLDNAFQRGETSMLLSLFGYFNLTSDAEGEDESASEEPKPAEPTCTKTCTDDCSSQDFDDIVKRGFRDHNRLRIAAMVIASIMGSENWTDYSAGTREGVWRNMAKASLGVTDALLKEWEEGGRNGED